MKGKKRLIGIIAGITMSALSITGLAACGNKHEHSWKTEWNTNLTEHWHEPKCNDTTELKDKAAHTWDNGVVVKAATHTKAGQKKYACTVCGYEKTETIPATGHTYADDLGHDDDAHWKVPTCECEDMTEAELKKDKAEHTLVSVVDTPVTDTANGKQHFECSTEGCDYKTEQVTLYNYIGEKLSGGDNVTVGNVEDDTTVIHEQNLADNKWTGAVKLTKLGMTEKQFIYDLHVGGKYAGTWGDAWAWQRFGIQVTENTGFYLWVRNDAVTIRKFTADNKTNAGAECQEEVLVRDNAEGTYGWISNAVLGTDGANFRIIRVNDKLNLYVENEGGYQYIGTVTCGEEANEFAIYGVTAEFTFSDFAVSALTHVDAKVPSETEAGHYEYYYTGSEDNKVYYDTNGKLTTWDKIERPAVIASAEVTLKTKKDGTTANFSGTTIKVNGEDIAVSGGKVTLIDIEPNVELTLATDEYTGKLTPVQGSTEYTVTLEYNYATGSGSADLSKMNDANHEIKIVGAGCPADGTPWSGYAEINIEHTNANSVIEFNLKDVNVRQGNFDWAARRIALQVAGNNGFFIWFNSDNEVMIRKLIDNNIGTNGSGQGGANEGAALNSNNGWMKAKVETTNGLKFRIVRIGTSLVLNAYNGTNWVYITETTCGADDQNKLIVYAQGDDYVFSDFAVSALTHVEEKAPSAIEDGNHEYYYTGSEDNKVYYDTNGKLTTWDKIVRPAVLEEVEITLQTKKDGQTVAFSGTTVQVDGKEVTVTGGKLTLENVEPNVEIIITYGDYTGTLKVTKATESVILEYNYATGSGSADLSGMNNANHVIKITGNGSADWNSDSWAGTAELALKELKAEKNVSYEFTLKSLKEGPFPSQRLAVRVAGEHSGFFFWLNGNEGNVRAMIAENLTKMSKEGSFIYSESSTAYGWITTAACGDGLQIRIVRLGNKIVFNAKNGEVWVRVGEIECDANAETNLTFFAGGSDWEFSNINVAKAEYIASGSGKLAHYKSGEHYYSENGSVVTEADITLWESVTLTLAGIAKDTEVVLFNADHSVTAKVGEDGVVTLTGESAVLKNVYTVIVGTFGFEADFTKTTAVEKTFATQNVNNATVQDKEGDNAYVIEMGEAKDSTEYSVTFNLKANTKDAQTWQYRFALLFINGDASTVTGIGSITGHDGNLMLWQATAANPNDSNATNKNDAASMKFCELVKGENGASVKFIRNGSKVTMYFEYNGMWVELYSVTLGSGETNLKFACNNGIEWALSDITIDYVSAAEAT